MSSAVVEEILEEAKSLPPDEQRQLQEALSVEEVGKGIAGLLMVIGLLYVLEKNKSPQPRKAATA
jgi:hypothetical protein